MEAELLQYLTTHEVELNPSLSLAQNICHMLDEKETIINNLSEQITRYKCEEMKNEKLIKNLQDKVNQLAPNIGNTSSNFMMSSEFKSQFDEFMTTTLPNSLGWAIDRPSLFSKCTEDIFSNTYLNIQQELHQLIDQICNTLKLSPLRSSCKDLEFKIKLSLLKILQ